MHVKELTVDDPVVIRKQNADEEAQEFGPEPATKEKTMIVLEVDCAASTQVASRCAKTMSRWSSEQKYLDSGIEGRLLAMRFRRKSLSLQTSVHDFLKSFSVARTSPPVLLYTGDDDPCDVPTV